MLKVASVLAAFVATSALADERCATFDGDTWDAVIGIVHRRLTMQWRRCLSASGRQW